MQTVIHRQVQLQLTRRQGVLIMQFLDQYRNACSNAARLHLVHFLHSLDYNVHVITTNAIVHLR